jgi:hypothetical protein
LHIAFDKCGALRTRLVHSVDPATQRVEQLLVADTMPPGCSNQRVDSGPGQQGKVGAAAPPLGNKGTTPAN